MNIRLKKLFTYYNLSLKDRRDFEQIYNLLPSDKRVRAIENFETMMANIEALREDLYLEHEILFGKTLENIEARIAKVQKTAVSNNAKEEITSLKNML